MYNFKNVLITGGAGFIGSNLINRIANKHKFSKIVSIDNYSTGNFKNHIRRKNIEYINLDCQKIFKTQNSLLKKFKPNYIFHLGEFSRVFPSFENKNKCFDSNIVGTLNVLKYSLKKKKQINIFCILDTLGSKTPFFISLCLDKSKKRGTNKKFF